MEMEIERERERERSALDVGGRRLRLPMSDGSFDGAAAAATLIHRQQLRRVHGRKTKAKRNRERKQKKPAAKEAQNGLVESATEC